MRDNNLNPAEIKTVYDMVSTGNLTISSAAYTIGDYLHTTVISLPVFPETTDSFVTLERYTIREVITAGTLQKAKLKLYFFSNNDMSITANDAFDWTDGTETTLSDLEYIGTVDTSNWTEIDSKNAVAEINLVSPVTFRNMSSNRTLYLIILANEAKTYDATAVINAKFIFRLH